MPETSPLPSQLLLGVEPQGLRVSRRKLLSLNRRLPAKHQQQKQQQQQQSGCGACMGCTDSSSSSSREVEDISLFISSLKRFLPIDFLLLPLADSKGDIPESLAAAVAPAATAVPSPIAAAAAATPAAAAATAAAAAAILDSTADPWLGGGVLSFSSFIPLGLSDLHLRCADWGTSVIGCISTWLHPDCSSSSSSSRNSWGGDYRYEGSCMGERLQRIYRFLKRRQILQLQQQLQQQQQATAEPTQQQQLQQQQLQQQLQQLQLQQQQDAPPAEIRGRLASLYTDSMAAGELLLQRQRQQQQQQHEKGTEEEEQLLQLAAAAAASPFLSSGFHMRRLYSEVSFAAHLNLQAIILPPPNTQRPILLARYTAAAAALAAAAAGIGTRWPGVAAVAAASC